MVSRLRLLQIYTRLRPAESTTSYVYQSPIRVPIIIREDLALKTHSRSNISSPARMLLLLLVPQKRCEQPSYIPVTSSVAELGLSRDATSSPGRRANKAQPPAREALATSHSVFIGPGSTTLNSPRLLSSATLDPVPGGAGTAEPPPSPVGW